MVGLYTVISGMINGACLIDWDSLPGMHFFFALGIALVELGTPVGYTSGGCVNSGGA